MMANFLRSLYMRWVAANALGEMLGLGLTFAIGALYFSATGEPSAAAAVLLSFAVAVASGVVEATIVGLLQWRAMHPWFPRVGRAAWWRGTLIGALLAYVLGYLPSTLISLAQAAAPEGAPMTEPPQIVVLLLAAGLGLAGGALLSFAQWLALRGKARRAGLWIPANMLAWTLGMPLIFWGIDMAQKGQPVWQSVLLMAGVLLLAGAVVGAVHGAFLARMAEVEEPAQAGP